MQGLSRRSLLGGVGAGLALAASPAAALVGAPRALRLYNTHTGESFAGDFHDGETYLAEARQRLDWFLRDHYENAAVPIDPGLFDILWTLSNRYRRARGQTPLINIHSGYRTEATNSRLLSEGAALNSYHKRGQAVDISVQGYGIHILANLSRGIGQGGWGIYWRSHFVHLDTGPARFWYRR